MRLTVLGGSAAGPNAGQGCSGYLVEAGDTRVVLDLGPGTLPELRRHTDFRTLAGIVISHLHLDHVLDLLALRFALAYNPRPAPSLVPLWLPPGGMEFLLRAAQAFAESDDSEQYFSSVFRCAEYDPGQTLIVRDARLSFAPTVHFVPCWAVRLEERHGGRALAYTADTGPAADLVDFVSAADVLVAEANFLEPAEQPPEARGHLTPVEAADLARRAQVSTLVLTHLWQENGFDRYREQAASVFSGRLELAVPGLVLSW